MKKIAIDKDHLSAAVWVSILSVIVLILLHSIAGIFEKYSLIGTTLHIVSAYFGVKFLLKSSELSFAECRITLPRFSYFAVVMAILYAVGYYVAVSTLPGSFIWSNLSLEQMNATLREAYFHSVAIPIAEELIFRAVVFKAYERCFGKVTSLFITSFIFTLGHIGNGIQPELLYWELTAIFVIGICANLLTLNNESVWDAVLFHGMCNLCGHGIIAQINNKVEKGFFTFLLDSPPSTDIYIMLYKSLIFVPAIFAVVVVFKMYFSKKLLPQKS